MVKFDIDDILCEIIMIPEDETLVVISRMADDALLNVRVNIPDTTMALEYLIGVVRDIYDVARDCL